MSPVVRIYSAATVDANAKPVWHHRSVIVLFQIFARLLTELVALTVYGHVTPLLPDDRYS